MAGTDARRQREPANGDSGSVSRDRCDSRPRHERRGGTRGPRRDHRSARRRRDAVSRHRAAVDARREGRGRSPGAPRSHPDREPQGFRETARSAGAEPRIQGAGRACHRRRARSSGVRRPRAAAGRRLSRSGAARSDAVQSGGCTRGGRSGGSGMTGVLVQSKLPLPLLRRGKVREVYEVDGSTLLLVASDRVSAFDVVMREAVAHKGAVLTQLSAFWFQRLATVMPSHLLTADAAEITQRVPAVAGARDTLSRRAMLARRTTPVPFECVVRGYLGGSAWAEDEKSGALPGEGLPAGLS